MQPQDQRLYWVLIHGEPTPGKYIADGKHWLFLGDVYFLRSDFISCVVQEIVFDKSLLVRRPMPHKGAYHWIRTYDGPWQFSEYYGDDGWLCFGSADAIPGHYVKDWSSPVRCVLRD